MPWLSALFECIKARTRGSPYCPFARGASFKEQKGRARITSWRAQTAPTGKPAPCPGTIVDTRNTDNSTKKVVSFFSLRSLCPMWLSFGSPKSPASCRLGPFGLYGHTSLRQCQGGLETRSPVGRPPGQKRKDRRSWRNGRIRFLRRQQTARPPITRDIIGLFRKHRTYGRFSQAFATPCETGTIGNCVSIQQRPPTTSGRPTASGAVQRDILLSCLFLFLITPGS